MLRASVDLMGGEKAPEAVLLAASRFPQLHFVFVGTKDVFPLIAEHGIVNYTFVEVKIALEEGVKYSKEQLEQSSLYGAIAQVASGNADFVISGGPTGYYILLLRMLIGMIDGVNRMALAAALPGKKPTIMMDLGANLTCDSKDLVDFAVMGEGLAKLWLKVDDPCVGFLNVGSEVAKGPGHLKAALNVYSNLNLKACFIEGNHVLDGKCDAVIVDGFSGNCLLKFGEGVVHFVRGGLKAGFLRNWFSKIVGFFAKRVLKGVFLDAREFNGGFFAGVKACAIKSHGSADVKAVVAAIKFATRLYQVHGEFQKFVKLSVGKLR